MSISDWQRWPLVWGAFTHIVSFHSFLKNVFYLFNYFFRERGREGEKERNITVWLPLERPPLRTWPTTQAYAPTGYQTSDPLVCRVALDPLSHQPGLISFLKQFCKKKKIYIYILSSLPMVGLTWDSKWLAPGSLHSHHGFEPRQVCLTQKSLILIFPSLSNNFSCRFHSKSTQAPPSTYIYWERLSNAGIGDKAEPPGSLEPSPQEIRTMTLPHRACISFGGGLATTLSIQITTLPAFSYG